MAPLPTESTSRIVVDYTWRGRGHQVLFRYRAPTLLSAMVTALNTFHTSIAPHFYTNWSVDGTAVEYQEGQTYSSPLAGITARAGTLTADPLNYSDAYQVQVVGRSAGGRKVAYFHQGFKYVPDVNQRVLGSDDASVQALLTAYTNLRSAGLVTINGLPPGFKAYVNLVWNDYLTRRARTG